MSNPTANVRVHGETTPVYAKAGQMLRASHYLNIPDIIADPPNEDDEVWVMFPLDSTTEEHGSAFDVLFSRDDLDELIDRLQRVRNEAWED